MASKNHGKKPNQKLKPYLVLQFLLRNTDEDHVVSGEKIAEFLKRCGVDAERRSVYRDIEDINKVMWLRENKKFTTEREYDDGITIEDPSYALPFPRSIAPAAYAKNVPPAHFLNAAGSQIRVLLSPPRSTA